MKYIDEPSGLSPTERWLFYKSLANEIKKELNRIEEDTLLFLRDNEDFYQTDFGKVQRITKVTSKPKDEMQIFLMDKGLLDICKKDEIDMKKVKELVEAEVLDEEEIKEYMDFKSIPYLKFKETN